MRYPNDICKLAINDMEIVENLPQIVSSIEQHLFHVIHERIQQFLNTKEQWGKVIEGDRNRYNISMFYPSHWSQKNPNSPNVCYGIGWLPTKDGAELGHWLSHAIGIRGASLSLFFWVNCANYNLKLKELKQILSEFLLNSELLSNDGFQLNNSGRSIYIPFHFNQAEFHEEYPSLDVSLEPLDDALEKLFEVHGEFDKFVKELEAKIE